MLLKIIHYFMFSTMKLWIQSKNLKKIVEGTFPRANYSPRKNMTIQY
jgi:hypothetical protein